jgi:hypothetical protein
MKVMLFHPPGSMELSALKSFGMMRAYYLELELRKLGVELVVKNWMRNSHLTKEELIRYHETLDITGIDHFIGHGIRYWSFLPIECGQALRARLGRHQCMAQIHDVSLLDKTAADVTFVHRDRSADYQPGRKDGGHERYHRHTCLIGWAADQHLCSPDQPEDELRILIDHPTYTHSSIDVTLSVLLNLRQLVETPELWSNRFKAIKVRQFVDGAIVDVDLMGDLSVTPYTRKAIPYVEACKEYSQAHIFLVTHSESLGQSVIEAATAGALVVAPETFIAADRLATIRHHEWSRFIRWDRVLPQIDVQASRAMAVKNSWEDMAKRIVEYLENFDRSKFGWPMPDDHRG